MNKNYLQLKHIKKKYQNEIEWYYDNYVFKVNRIRSKNTMQSAT